MRRPYFGNPERRLADLRADAVAGLTTAIMLVPQSMAYAMLAGLPPQVGLYAAVIPPAIYAFFGTSRQLAVGPVAMDSLLVAVTVSALTPQGSEDYVPLAVLLALLVGIMQVLMGFMRLGFLTNFLGTPVLSGFTSAAALVIGLNQLEHVLGIDLPGGTNVFAILGAALGHLGDIQPATLILGVGSLAILLILKRYARKIPGALVVVVITTVLVTTLGLSGQVAVVGVVPSGLPAPSMPELHLDLWEQLLPGAFAIALVGFMESISVSKALAARHGYKVGSSQELIALGAANFGGAFFGAYPITGGFSRSAVNAQAGARSNLAGLITALLVLVALSFLTPYFHDLPKAALAAIIMTAVFGLVDLDEPRRLWRVHRVDFVLLIVTFVATLALGIQKGILTGVLAAIAFFVVRSTRPHFAVLGRKPGTDAFRNVRNHPDVELTPGVLMVRFDATFYFGNVSFLETTLERLERESEEPLHTVILDFASVNGLDSSADAALLALAQAYRARGIRFAIAQAKRPVLDVMERSGLASTLGADAYHLTLGDALERGQESAGSSEGSEASMASSS